MMSLIECASWMETPYYCKLPINYLQECNRSSEKLSVIIEACATEIFSATVIITEWYNLGSGLRERARRDKMVGG